MIDKRSPFFAYRYLVTPVNQQITIHQVLAPTKEELMKELVNELAWSKKIEYLRGNKRYLFYGFQQHKAINILKFAKESIENIYIEGDEDIEIQDIKEAKFVLVIIDTIHQIILIERNSSVFTSMKNAAKVLQEFFRDNLLEYDYAVNVYPLASNRRFWSYVESADEIYQLSLVMNAPNMPFFGNQDTRDVLKIIQEETNNEELDITLKNKEGELVISRNILGSWIDYVREVGGKYLLKFAKDGNIEVKTSDSDNAKTYIPRKKKELYSEDEIRNIEDKLKAIHNLETRDKTDDSDDQF